MLRNVGKRRLIHLTNQRKCNFAECPICKCGLTSWRDSQQGDWVCDTCGFGKGSKNQFKTLQKIVKYRKDWFEYDFMEDFEVCYIMEEKE